MLPRMILVLAALPLTIDFSVTFFGFWENTHTSRLLTGALLVVSSLAGEQQKPGAFARGIGARLGWR